MAAIRKSYQKNLTDEFVVPTLMEDCSPHGTIREGALGPIPPLDG